MGVAYILIIQENTSDLIRDVGFYVSSIDKEKNVTKTFW